MDPPKARTKNQMDSNDGRQQNAQQQRRLARHFVASNTLSFVLLAAACSFRLSTPDTARSHVFVATTIVIVCFTITAIILTHAIGHKHIDALCVAAYVITGLLMLVPMSLLLLLDKAYTVVMVPLFPVGICLLLVLRKGAQIGFASGTAHYEQLGHNLSCLFNLAGCITFPSYTGLVGHTVSKLRIIPYPQEGIGVNAVECLLLYSVVVGLVLMLLASSPPALYMRKTRAVIVSRFLGALADVQVGLVALAGFLQTTEMARGYAILALATPTLAGCAIFVREHEDEPDRRGEHEVKQHLCVPSPPSMVLLTVHSIAFTVLMVCYSTGKAASGPASFGSGRTMTVVVVAASFAISSLSQIALQRRAPRTESMLFCIAMFRKVHYVSLAIVITFSVMMSRQELSKAKAYIEEFLVIA